MAGGAPIPIPTSDLEEKILSIKDLERAASKKLDKSTRGNRLIFLHGWLNCCFTGFRLPSLWLVIN